MPNWGYSVIGLNSDRTAKASGRDLRISPKATTEVCKVIRGMNLNKARNYLQDVLDEKRFVPYKRHKKKVAHKTGMKGWYAGRRPVKAIREVMKILTNVEANASDKGLDIDRLKIVHVSAQKARTIKGYVPRAFGRSSPNHNQLCHVELIVEEM
jgi:large subunit ribosomal protein L22